MILLSLKPLRLRSGILLSLKPLRLRSGILLSLKALRLSSGILPSYKTLRLRSGGLPSLKALRLRSGGLPSLKPLRLRSGGLLSPIKVIRIPERSRRVRYLHIIRIQLKHFAEFFNQIVDSFKGLFIRLNLEKFSVTGSWICHHYLLACHKVSAKKIIKSCHEPF